MERAPFSNVSNSSRSRERVGFERCHCIAYEDTLQSVISRNENEDSTTTHQSAPRRRAMDAHLAAILLRAHNRPLPPRNEHHTNRARRSLDKQTSWQPKLVRLINSPITAQSLTKVFQPARPPTASPTLPIALQHNPFRASPPLFALQQPFTFHLVLWHPLCLLRRLLPRLRHRLRAFTTDH